MVFAGLFSREIGGRLGFVCGVDFDRMGQGVVVEILDLHHKFFAGFV